MFQDTIQLTFLNMEVILRLFLSLKVVFATQKDYERTAGHHCAREAVLH